ncbi:expressed unknown protein [Seminavis robusta]|uniref:Uncharacterized protein n=1 Tax=Seminavis robusta TaxID=568900 RepID=A0A9N8EY86_9STRA|nr:expressed unknown protein [Seminavis robusta]|eukprot:Sro1959_g307940.1 n/a (185) ;mRNA; r:6090-6644
MTFRSSILALALALLSPIAALGAGGEDIRITETFYPAMSNHAKICKHYFGQFAVPLDFETDLHGMAANAVAAWAAEHGIPATRHAEHYFVTNNGAQMYPGTNQHAYFFEYHAGPPPAFFDAIEKHGGLSLGATSKYGKVVCKVPNNPERKLRQVKEEEDVVDEEPVEEVKEEEEAPRKLGWGWF